MIKKIEDDKNVAKSDVMEMALMTVSDVFNLDSSYTMLAFKDTQNNCSVTLANQEYEVTVKIKDKEYTFEDEENE